MNAYYDLLIVLLYMIIKVIKHTNRLQTLLVTCVHGHDTPAVQLNCL